MVCIFPFSLTSTRLVAASIHLLKKKTKNMSKKFLQPNPKHFPSINFKLLFSYCTEKKKIKKVWKAFHVEWNFVQQFVIKSRKTLSWFFLHYCLLCSHSYFLTIFYFIFYETIFISWNYLFMHSSFLFIMKH